MKTVVVTGSTRGIGRGLVEEFLKRDCQVVVSSRHQAAVDEVVAELAASYGADKVAGCACDISSEVSLRALWDAAISAFGQVDVWVNNAGISLDRKPIWEQSPADLKQISNTNLDGILLAAHVVLGEMVKAGKGQMWNMEGFGSDGMTSPGMVAYGATKRAVNYINKALVKEVAGTGVQVCTLSPGMVVTDLLISDYDHSSEEWAKTKKIFNILADKVETVTPFLAEGILAADKNGASVKWLTRSKAAGRFMTAAFNKRDLFSELGI
ncbi:MAG: SDR family NAD(P)-dependent oxidoreductase [Pseudomonadales bacterium]